MNPSAFALADAVVSGWRSLFDDERANSLPVITVDRRKQLVTLEFIAPDRIIRAIAPTPDAEIVAEVRRIVAELDRNLADGLPEASEILDTIRRAVAP